MEQKKSTSSTKTSVSHATVVTETRRPFGGLFSNKAFMRYLWIVLAGIVVLTGGVVYLNRRSSNSVAHVCSDSLLQQASSQYANGNVSELTLSAGQIKSLKSYARDPNCMYAIIEYQLLTSDLASAKSNINALKQSHSSFVFSKALDNGSASIKRLQSQYDIMQNANQNAHGRIDPSI